MSDPRQSLISDMRQLSGKLVFDIGANVGSRTVEYVRLGARVIAVEPQSELTVGSNFVGPVTVVNKCVSSHTGKIDFYRSKDSVLSTCDQKWMNVGRFKGRNYVKSPDSVECVTLDNLIEQYGAPHMIKIDVEGHEVDVMKGLTSKVTVILYEYTHEFFFDAITCADHLDSLGFTQFAIMPRSNIDRLQYIGGINDFRCNVQKTLVYPDWGDVVVR